MEFGYWKIRGLGAAFRMLLEYKEVEYKDSQYETEEEWFEGRKPEILKLTPLANLPYLIDGDACICQTNAILVYLGDKYGMNGNDSKAKLRNMELLEEIYDVRNALVGLSYPFLNKCRSTEEFEESAKKLVSKPPFAKFEAVLSRNESNWFVAGSEIPCVADFHIWEMMDQHVMLGAKLGVEGNILAEFPLCKAFYDRFRALPTLQKYFESDAYKFPVNSPIADAYFL